MKYVALESCTTLPEGCKSKRMYGFVSNDLPYVEVSLRF